MTTKKITIGILLLLLCFNTSLLVAQNKKGEEEVAPKTVKASEQLLGLPADYEVTYCRIFVQCNSETFMKDYYTDKHRVKKDTANIFPSFEVLWHDMYSRGIKDCKIGIGGIVITKGDRTMKMAEKIFVIR